MIRTDGRGILAVVYWHAVGLVPGSLQTLNDPLHFFVCCCRLQMRPGQRPVALRLQAVLRLSYRLHRQTKSAETFLQPHL